MEAPDDPRVGLFWEGERVRVTLDEELWAVADATEGRGWSKLIVLAGRFGRPLRELEEGAGLGAAPTPPPDGA
jgi:hypothetical protein